MTSARSSFLAVTLLSLALTRLDGITGQPGRAAAATPRRLTVTEAARLVSRVRTPVLHWTTCRKTAQCATAQLPLSYQNPHGPKIRLALLRIRAKDPRHRIGTIFLNPGGPGQSARDFAFSAPPALPEAILDRFDLVGVDPRGVGGRTAVNCFTGNKERIRTEAPFNAEPFPVIKAQQRSWIVAARRLGRACSTTDRSIVTSMSTTDDALDMEVLRRAVGDRKLTYLGESYGSYLGLVYANLFPSRVRAIVIDGIVNPTALVGTPGTAHIPVSDRMGSAAASIRALNELLKLCQQAGRPRCRFATKDTTAQYARLAAQLKAHPLRLAAKGLKPTSFSYAELIDDTEHWMHSPAGYRGLFPELADLAELLGPGGGGANHAALVRELLRLLGAVQEGPIPANQLEAQSGVLCADSRNAHNAASWPAAAVAADRQARYFGALYAWSSVQCARRTWPQPSDEVYEGPFDHRTAAPVLVIGNRWDPATSYYNALQVARRLPSSRLVASDGWGHTALLTSACVDNTTWNYLLHPQARAAPKVTHCRGDVQPFAH